MLPHYNLNLNPIHGTLYCVYDTDSSSYLKNEHSVASLSWELRSEIL